MNLPPGVTAADSKDMPAGFSADPSQTQAAAEQNATRRRRTLPFPAGTGASTATT